MNENNPIIIYQTEDGHTISVGYRVKSQRGVQFRRWAEQKESLSDAKKKIEG